MLPWSAAGRQIVTEVETGAKVYTEPSREKLVFLRKKNKDQLLGFRFGIHPESQQACLTTYPCLESTSLISSPPTRPPAQATDLSHRDLTDSHQTPSITPPYCMPSHRIEDKRSIVSEL